MQLVAPELVELQGAGLVGPKPGSGCSWPVGVGTGSDRSYLGDWLGERPPGGWGACWQQLGQVWLLSCEAAWPAGSVAILDAVVLTGDREIWVSDGISDDAPALARRLRRASDGAPLADAPPPSRLTCDEVKHAPRAFRAAIPAELRPRHCTP